VNVRHVRVLFHKRWLNMLRDRVGLVRLGLQAVGA
jgi:hypothetical protein